MKYGRMLLLGLACALPQAAAASDPPDSRYNAVTGLTETVDMVQVQGQYEIRYTTSDGLTKPNATILTSNPAHDRRPRIAVSASGDTFVCWYRETSPASRVICRELLIGASEWSPEREVSESSEVSRLPEVAYDGTKAWVAFEFADGTSKGIAVNTVDEPEPILTRLCIAHTPFGGDLDLRLHRMAGALWVTWIDSSWEVGWSEYDHATGDWGSPEHAPYWLNYVELTLELVESVVLAP